MKDIPSIGKLDKGLSFSEDPIFAGSPSDGFLQVPMWACQNYELNKNGGIEQAMAVSKYDGRIDYNNIQIYIAEGNVAGSEALLLNPSTGEPWTEGTSEGIWFGLDVEGTGIATSITYHLFIALAGPLGYTRTPLNWNTVTINGFDVITTDPTFSATKIYELDKSLMLVDGARFTGTDGHGNSPPAEVMLMANYYISRIMGSSRPLAAFYGTGDLRLPTANATTGAYTGGLFYFDNELHGVDASTFTASEGQTLYRAIKAVPGSSVAGWVEQDMGQEMAFNEGVFPIRFEDYIAWESSSRASYILGGTSSSTELDYFPGQVAYHIDGSNTEYWATVVHAHAGDGEFATGRYTDCEVATTVNIDTLDTTEYDNGGTIDGYTLATNDRVLVKDQDNAEENGIYVVQAAGALVRATDLDFEVELVTGHVTAVTDGDENGGKVFRVLNVDDLSVGVTGQLWTETTLAEGALTLYDVVQRTAGGTVTTTGITFPLSATWTEGNAVNFSGGDNEPALGDRITDGTASATVLKVIVDQGDWSTNDASGTIVTGGMTGGTEMASGASITNTTQAGEAVGTTINIVRDSDRDDLFDNTTVNVAVTLPSFEELAAAGSKYQHVVHNFFATDDENNNLQQPSRKVYVVNGAGNALQWDGTHLIRIRTGQVDERPRHVSIHGDRLCLGYADGTVNMSVAGEPLNFNGVDGALSFGFKENITGLVKVEADTTAVFTSSTVSTISGTTDLNMIQQDISINSGALEYTAVDMGQVVFTDRHGISTLQAADTYGDFGVRPLSQRIDSWLLPRIRAAEPLIEGVTTDLSDPVRLNGSLDMALPVRGKAQYRLFFTDGEVLVGTIMPDGRMEFGRHVLFNPRQPAYKHWQSCAVAGINTRGEDELFYQANRASLVAAGSSSGEVYQLDCLPGLYAQNGAGNDGTDSSWVVLGPIFPTVGQSAVHWNTIRLHGEYVGALDIDVGAVGVDYNNPVTWQGTASSSDADESISSEDDPLLKIYSRLFAKLTDFDNEEVVGADDLKRVSIGLDTNRWRQVNNYFYRTIEVPGRGTGLMVGIFTRSHDEVTARYPHRLTSMSIDTGSRKSNNS